jgi:hypothetical protein
MHTARPVLLDLADRPDIRETAQNWQHRIDIRTARTDHRPADALLIRPDAYIAWAAPASDPAPAGTATPAPASEPADTDTAALREALSGWFGRPPNPRFKTEDFLSPTP